MNSKQCTCTPSSENANYDHCICIPSNLDVINKIFGTEHRESFYVLKSNSGLPQSPPPHVDTWGPSYRPIYQRPSYKHEYNPHVQPPLPPTPLPPRTDADANLEFVIALLVFMIILCGSYINLNMNHTHNTRRRNRKNRKNDITTTSITSDNIDVQ